MAYFSTRSETQHIAWLKASHAESVPGSQDKVDLEVRIAFLEAVHGAAKSLNPRQGVQTPSEALAALFA
jgi:hypothetical protein